MITVQVNANQVARFSAKLRDFALNVRDPTLANRSLSIELYQFVMRNFDTEGGMTKDGSWAPLADSTVEWKERHGYAKILQNEGELRDSFMPFHDRFTAGVGAVKLPPISKAALKSAKASDKAYDQRVKKGKMRENDKPVEIKPRPPDIALVHEYGSEDGTVPARPMLPDPEQTIAIAMRVYGYYIAKATERAK